MELGMKNQNLARLTTNFVSQEGKALESWKYGMVSTNWLSADFASAKLLLSYFASLCEVAMKTGGNCYEDITSASLNERAASNSGLKACFKGADAQASSLCIFSSQLKPLVGKVGSSTIYLTSHGSAAAGRTITPTLGQKPRLQL
ncbi:TPA: hypothetical protein ACH3X2_010554 [Trebouxia sp. C0005]